MVSKEPSNCLRSTHHTLCVQALHHGDVFLDLAVVAEHHSHGDRGESFPSEVRDRDHFAGKGGCVVVRVLLERVRKGGCPRIRLPIVLNIEAEFAREHSPEMS